MARIDCAQGVGSESSCARHPSDGVRKALWKRTGEYAAETLDLDRRHGLVCRSFRRRFNLTFAGMAWLAVALVISPAAMACQVQRGYAGELSGLDASEAANIDDGQPPSENRDVLLRLLYRAKRSAPKQLREYQHFSESIALNEVLNSPRAYRGWVFRISGIAKQISWVKLPLESGDAIEKYCLVDIELADRSHVQVAALEIPDAWNRTETLGEPVSFYGFFALASATDWPTVQSKVLLFVTPRIEWYPTSLSKEFRIGAGQLALARAGFDVGLLDHCQRLNFKPMDAGEGEVFYSMLSAVGRIASSGTSDPAAPKIGFLELMAEPRKHAGDVVVWEGSVKRIIPVSVDQPYRPEVGPEYYQIDMFIPLPDNSRILMGPDENKLEFRTRFPVTVHVGSLTRPISEYSRAQVRVTGHFYRFWNYQSSYSDEHGVEAGQYSPMIMASRIEIIPPTDAGAIAWFPILILVAVLLLIVVVALVGRMARKPRLEPEVKITLPTAEK